ncbi:hypothetical protein CDAR_512511 [Caerostris darwini]|uniref:Uncharacterized protein n=1 Tax=Caerostris darwini TaxID=1538125 RepID=A0AAV4RJL8_9ARAC|nr:hypothetical protein CDAR_512511 [Caerostris darwini]
MTRNGTAPNGKGIEKGRGVQEEDRKESRSSSFGIARRAGGIRNSIPKSIVHWVEDEQEYVERDRGNLITDHRSSSSVNGSRERSLRDILQKEIGTLSLKPLQSRLPMPPPLPFLRYLFKHAPPVTTQISRYRAPSSLASHELQEPGLHPNPLTPRSSPEFHPSSVDTSPSFLAAMGNFELVLLLPCVAYSSHRIAKADPKNT